MSRSISRMSSAKAISFRDDDDKEEEAKEAHQQVPAPREEDVAEDDPEQLCIYMFDMLKALLFELVVGA